ncbi:hypothetical protein ACFX2K_007129 [Malus domestica]
MKTMIDQANKWPLIVFLRQYFDIPALNICERSKELKADAKLKVPDQLVIDIPGHKSHSLISAHGVQIYVMLQFWLLALWMAYNLKQ